MLIHPTKWGIETTKQHGKVHNYTTKWRIIYGKPVVCTVAMTANEWLYVFGFATHILQFKAIQPIGKTDVYNVLPPVFPLRSYLERK